MDSKVLLTYCLNKPGVEETYPFGFDVTVLKLMDKVYALISVRDDQLNLSLKCDPELAEVIRNQYPSITPGYHLNKRHWNTLIIDGSIPDDEIRSQIDHSYALIAKSLSRTQKKALELLNTL